MRRVRIAFIICAIILSAQIVGPAPVECVPEEAEAIMAEARELMREGDASGALSKVERAAAVAPHWPLPHASLGVLNQLRGRDDLAREHYTQVQLISLLREGAEDTALTRDIAEGEALMVYLVNLERTQRGLRLLRPHADLAIVARGHSREMRDLGFFGHLSPRRQNRRPSDRFHNLFNHAPRAIGENLARMSSSSHPVFTREKLRDSHERLMSSERHRRTILWDVPDHIGVGIAVNSAGDFWITESFSVLQR